MSIRKQSSILLASAARTATPDPVFITPESSGYSVKVGAESVVGQIVNMHIIIDVSALSLTPTIVPTFMALDPASGDYYPLLDAITPITAVGTTVFRLGRDIIELSTLSSTDFLPENLRFAFTHLDADSITYSVGMNYELEQ